MNRKQISFVFFSLMSLTGCTYSSHFDCPVGEGNKCTSLSENDRKISRREYEESSLVDSELVEGNSFYFREDFER